jgi:hypothetical protein
MDPAARDSTQDWLLPEQSRPPLIGELERRIDEALATARASEAAVMTVGAAALDAAEQARRAAGLAEQASATALAVQRPPDPSPLPTPAPAAPGGGLDDFHARADFVAERLRDLQRVPLPVRDDVESPR